MKSKKIAAFVMTGVLSSVMVLNSTAYANDGDAQMDYEEYVQNSEEGKMTPESIEKFNDFIGSLDAETAGLILQDEELVYSMQLDTCWAEDNNTDISPLASKVVLPLSEYPDDGKTYYSVSKTGECTCHKKCTYELPKGYQTTTKCYIPSEGTSGKCVRWAATGSIQCKGFADYVYYKYTGKNCGVINTSYKVSEADWSVDKCKEKFVGLSRGSHLRGYVYGNDGVTEIPHSIIILSTDLKGINYYQANVGGKCLVSTDYKTWDEFADWFFKTTGAWVA